MAGVQRIAISIEELRFKYVSNKRLVSLAVTLDSNQVYDNFELFLDMMMSFRQIMSEFSHIAFSKMLTNKEQPRLR